MPNIEEHIRKAIEEGKFNDLPGKGKPINLDDNPHADPEWDLAYHMLKGAGFTLPWIETRQEILTLLEEQRQTLRQAWNWRTENLPKDPTNTLVAAEWQRALEAFRDQITRLDRRIVVLNLEVPNPRFQLARLQVEKEIVAVTHPQSDENGAAGNPGNARR
jgi:DnaJ family protein C protein 28